MPRCCDVRLCDEESWQTRTDLLQFDELPPEHVEACLTMALDEACCDIILAAGYRDR